MRLNFKCGWLTIRDGLIQWQHNRELLTKHGLNSDTISVPTTVCDSHQVSAVTPSVARFSKAARSVDQTSFHMANPNPQNHAPKFKGPREVASSTARSGFTLENIDLLRFGKRVNFGNKLTTNDVLEDHLRQIKNHKQQHRYEKDNKLLQEKEDIKRIE